jgi:pilus assembly protein CpaB
MRKGNLPILIIAIAMGSIAALLARNWIQAQANVTSSAPTGTIAVAAAQLGFGTALSRENVNEIPWAAGALPDGAYATRDELFKDGRRVVLTAMQRGELILKAKITGPGQRASLSALLEEGKRAVTVRVDDVRGVAGFVLPGDRVDVVLIRSVAGLNNSTENYSDVLLQHVKVLAVDQLANERQETPTIAKAVTLEVETDQAQKILLATNIGKLSLILRQAGENNPAVAKRITESDLGIAEARKPGPAQSAAPQAAPSTSATVEVVRSGMKIEKYNVIRAN